MSKSVRKASTAFAIGAASVAGLVAPSAAAHIPTTYGFEVTGGSAEAVGVVFATVDEDNIDITVNVDGLGVEEVVMHFHEGSTCDAAGGVVVSVPTGATPQASPDGSLRLETTEPIGDADMENVYFNIHESGNLGNVVACATLAETAVTEYTKSAGTATSLLVTNTIAGDTVQTRVEAGGLDVPNVVMHFHTGATCDAMGGIVLNVDGGQVPVVSGGLDQTFVAPLPAGLEDPAAVYFNVHDGADLANVVGCGTYTTFIAKAATIEEIVNATDYDVETDPEVLRLYQAFFNREPDVGGAIYWIGIRDTNSSLEIAGFFPGASQEFQNTYQDAADNNEFLTRVYNNILDRVPDDGGFAYWLDILNGTNESGDNPDLQMGDRATVVYYVAVNAEFVNSFPYLP